MRVRSAAHSTGQCCAMTLCSLLISRLIDADLSTMQRVSIILNVMSARLRTKHGPRCSAYRGRPMRSLAEVLHVAWHEVLQAPVGQLAGDRDERAHVQVLVPHLQDAPLARVDKYAAHGETTRSAGRSTGARGGRRWRDARSPSLYSSVDVMLGNDGGDGQRERERLRGCLHGAEFVGGMRAGQTRPARRVDWQCRTRASLK